MSITYFVGLDLGTSSTKAVAFSKAGEVLHTQQQAYALEQHDAGAAVQNPEDIIQAAESVLKDLLQAMKAAPRAIGLVSVMHSLLLINEEGRPKSPLYTWADLRAQEVAKTLRESEEGQSLFRDTGVPIHAMSPLCKLLWLRQTQQLPTHSTLRFVGIKDYLLYRWFGQWWVDESTASATGFMHLAKRVWHQEALALADIEESQLPDLCSPLKSFSAGESPFLQSIGLGADTRIIIGGADGCLANLGAGVLQPGMATLTIGTSGAIRMTSEQATTDEKMRLFSYYLADGKYVMGGATNNGGKAWEWFCKSFYPDLSFLEALERTTAIAPGANGLIAIPYVFGERAPVWDAGVTASFKGITHIHSRDHMARAFLESIFFNLRISLEALITHFGPVNTIVANGGFTQSDIWVQLLADIMELQVEVSDSPHGTAYGAALLARKAVGDLEYLSNVQGLPISRSFEPNPEHAAAYRKIYREWKGRF